MSPVHSRADSTSRSPLKGACLPHSGKGPVLEPGSDEEPTRLSDRIQEVREWARGNTVNEHYLLDITREDLENLEARLSEEGIRIRYDWSIATRTAILRMPKLIHELPASWLQDAVGEITRHLAKVAVCSKPVVRSGCSGSCPLKDGGKTPDGSLYLRLRLEDGAIDTVLPRVVLETAHSQKLKPLMHKAWHYLYKSKLRVHAVVLCTTTYPISGTRNFKAKISVWVRATTGDVDIDFPFEKCHDGESDEEDSDSEESEDEGGEPEDGESASNPPSLTDDHAGTSVSQVSLVEEDLELARTFAPKPNDPKIWRRSVLPITIVDETLQEQPTEAPMLLFDVYDFLRICKEQPETFIAERALPISLESLREDILVHLRTVRRGSEKKRATARPRISPPEAAHELGRLDPDPPSKRRKTEA